MCIYHVSYHLYIYVYQTMESFINKVLNIFNYVQYIQIYISIYISICTYIVQVLFPLPNTFKVAHYEKKRFSFNKLLEHLLAYGSN